MNPEEINIKVIQRVDRDSVKKLYQQAGWWNGDDDSRENDSWIDDLVAGSFCFVGAFAGGEMVGMGRAISDGVSDAYVQDVTVLGEFRGMGLGARIIDEITAFLRGRRIGWIGLIAEPGTQVFYGRRGFTVMDGYSPMLLGEKRADSCRK
jgi:ribosomal protein S18 acetylase RimI-like enzyme